MDTIIYKHGIDYLRWTDENGNIWTARKDEVEWFGKECFEQMPNPEDNLGKWEVCYDEEYLDCLSITDEEWQEIINL